MISFLGDECRFGRQGTLTRVWVRRGSRPTAVRQTEYGYLWVIAAASPETGQAEAILAQVLNTVIINQFLEQFSRSLDPDVHAALIWDGAGFHRSKELVVPPNITLIRLPPDSPELPCTSGTGASRTCGTTSAATAGRTEPTRTTTRCSRPRRRPGTNTA